MKPIRVLIVEDEALEAFLLSNCFQLEGYHVCEMASRGSEALRITRQDQPDVIVMDVGLLGGLSGIDTACQIREFSSAPILFLTGYLSDQLKAQIELLHPVSYLTKPARVNEVLHALQLLMAPSQSNRAHS